MQSERNDISQDLRITKKGKIDQRGRKKCPECGTITGVRKIRCQCGHEFKPKASRKNQIKNWKELQHGDIIKVVPRSYFLSTDEDTGEQNRIPFGFRGICTVHKIMYNGFVAFNKHDHTEFVYMGDKYFNNDLGIYKRPSLIFKHRKRRTKYNAN